MLVPYVIRQGDFLDKLAYRHSFDRDEIWNDPKNAALQKTRSNPNLLAPGDVLYIPAKVERNWLSVNVGATNKFTATLPMLTINLTMTCDGEPLANKDCRLEGYGEAKPLTTGGDGSVTFKIPVTVDVVYLVFDDPPVSQEIRPGHMDPHEAPSGVAMRLANLGYLDDAALSPDIQADALLAFQADNGIEPTGVADDATVAKLVEVHGH
jgi:hypothetical protein